MELARKGGGRIRVRSLQDEGAVLQGEQRGGVVEPGDRSVRCSRRE